MFWIAAVAMTPPRPPYSSARASASERAPGSRPAQRGGAERSRKPAHEHVAPPGIGDHGGLEPGLLQQPDPGGAREEPFDVAVVHDAGDARLVAEQDRVVHQIGPVAR